MNFDWIIYKELNPDLQVAGLTSQKDYENHFKNHCVKDKRIYNIYQKYPDFNPLTYSKIYKELSSLSRVQLERHWIEHGRHENRVYTVDKPVQPHITFIIPTIGRDTLINAINSILRQTNNNWKCIIVCDGIELNESVRNLIQTYNRISTIKIPKTGVKNNAGIVRNHGLKQVNTEWVGFLDDDDQLSPLYVESFTNHVNNHSNISCIIFRMMYNDGGIVPEKDSINFIKDKVGISFCYNTVLISKDIVFVANDVEDFLLLNKIRKCGYKMLMSNKICYFVRHNDTIELNYVNALKNIENHILQSIIN
jgi:hypothetical protein